MKYVKLKKCSRHPTEKRDKVQIVAIPRFPHQVNQMKDFSIGLCPHLALRAISHKTTQLPLRISARIIFFDSILKFSTNLQHIP